MILLVTINHLEKWGGAERYVYFITKGFLELGHRVSILSIIKGGSYLEILKLGAVPYNEETKYDIAICTHNSTILNIRATTILQICHGIYPYLEQPVLNLDGYISVSQEVCNRLNKNGILNQIIMNPIQTENNLKNQDTYVDVLSLCQGFEANKFLEDSCKSLELSFIAHNKHQNENKDIYSLINRSNLIVGTGRAIIEALSKRKQIILFDSRHYDGVIGIGLVTYDQIEKASSTNFSGRNLPKINPNKIREEIIKGMNLDFDERLYEYVVANNNYKLICTKIMDYATECKRSFSLKRCLFNRRAVMDLRSSDEINRWVKFPIKSK